MKRIFISLFLIMAISSTAIASTIGSAVKKNNKTTMRLGAYRTQSNISVIEYDTYGAESGYYIDDAFGMTTKYDKNGNIVSKYKSNQAGRTYVYNKYNNVIGYLEAVSKTRTVMFDKTNTPVGYFQVDRDGYVKKYDMEGIHLNTYKKF